MTIKTFKIIKTGISTTIQGQGDYGFLKDGVAIYGALDEQAFYWGNYLLGNKPQCASLEILIGQCELLALINSKISVCGADLNFAINGNITPTWQVVSIKKGDKLTWSRPNSGLRAYLCIQGGFIDVIIKAQAILFKNTINKQITSFIPRRFIPDYHKHLVLRICWLDNDYFTQDDQQKMCKTLYKISKKNNRTAYQLESGNIKPKIAQNISEANTIGSVQITPDGCPIIMLRDCPTIGGYPKIGVVFSLDISKLAQRGSNDYLSFQAISIDEIHSLRRKFNTFFKI